MAEATLFYKLFILILMVGCGAIDDSCLKCLCEFISEGPVCQSGCRRGICGIYGITLPFWVDGGRLDVGGVDDVSKYQRCANDVNCAERTIRNYMDRYHKDCNQDGFEDCLDFASIHFNGPFSCQKPLGDRAKQALTTCLERSNSIPDDNQSDPYPDYGEGIIDPRILQ